MEERTHAAELRSNVVGDSELSWVRAKRMLPQLTNEGNTSGFHSAGQDVGLALVAYRHL